MKFKAGHVLLFKPSSIAGDSSAIFLPCADSCGCNACNELVCSRRDAEGAENEFAYSYDAQNRLVSVSSNDVVLLVNEYDSKSRRVRKITPEAAATFFYDDWNLIEERIAYTNGMTSTIHKYNKGSKK